MQSELIGDPPVHVSEDLFHLDYYYDIAKVAARGLEMPRMCPLPHLSGPMPDRRKCVLKVIVCT